MSQSLPASSGRRPSGHSVPPPTLNLRRLEAIARDSSREFLVELAQLFVKDVGERIQSLSTMVRRRDPSGTADAAHGVQSAASSLGVLRLRSLAAALERHAVGGDWSLAESALERIVKEFAHVKSLLEAIRASD